MGNVHYTVFSGVLKRGKPTLDCLYRSAYKWETYIILTFQECLTLILNPEDKTFNDTLCAYLYWLESVHTTVLSPSWNQYGPASIDLR